MANVTISVPDDLKSKMDSRPEVNWSEAIRQVIRRTIDDFELLEHTLAKSKFTQSHADELSKKIDSAMATHARKLLNAPRG